MLTLVQLLRILAVTSLIPKRNKSMAPSSLDDEHSSDRHLATPFPDLYHTLFNDESHVYYKFAFRNAFFRPLFTPYPPEMTLRWIAGSSSIDRRLFCAKTIRDVTPHHENFALIDETRKLARHATRGDSCIGFANAWPVPFNIAAALHFCGSRKQKLKCV
jgi:hypothetical protein